MLLLQRKKKLIIEESSLALWLDGDDHRTFSLSGTTVTQWRDKSGKGRHTTPSGVIIPSSSAGRVNGRNAMYLDGTAGFVPLPSSLYGLNTPGTLTIVVVARSNGPNGAAQALIGAQAGGTIVLSMQKRNVGPGIRMRAGTASADTTFALGTSTRVWVLRKDAGTVRAYVDQNVLNTASAANNVINQSFNIGKFDAFPTQLWAGEVCEVFMYTDTKSIAFLNSLRADYLAPKWGTVATAI